jgi:hypothetical protein
MKLSEIVSYLNLLETFSVDIECNEAIRNLFSVLHVVTNHKIQIDSDSSDLSKDFDTIRQSMTNFSVTLEQIKKNVKQEILDREPEYFKNSLQLFTDEMVSDANDMILKRRIGIDDQSNILLRSRLRNSADWRYPGLIFRPGEENFIEEMVPLDPLYLVDHNEELLKPSVHKFTIEYQQRLRQYAVDDRRPGKFLERLPDNQFGVIFAYNYFNYKPYEIVCKYLDELLIKLRPGGKLIMTYNNCDRAHNVALAERAWMTYLPKRLLTTYAADIGFEFVFSHDGEGDISWIEFRKPGDIDSFRGGQSLAKVIAITNE